MPSVTTWGLDDVDVVGEVWNEADLRVIVTLKQHQNLPACPSCGGRTHWHGRRDLHRIVDTPAHGYRVSLNIQRRRSICIGECRRSIEVDTPFVRNGYKVTQRLWIYLSRIFTELNRSLMDVAYEVGLSDRSAERMFNEIAEEKLQQRRLQPVLGRVLRIDEVSVSGRSYLAMINLREETLVELLEWPKADREFLTQVLRDLGHRGGPQRVLIPACEEVRSAVSRAFPWARIALTLSTVREVTRRIGKEALKNKTPEAKKVVMQLTAALIGPQESSRADISREPRAFLRQVRADLTPAFRTRLPWLDEWLSNWESEILQSASFSSEEREKQRRTETALKTAIERLNMLNRRYAFGQLRLRLLLSLGQSKAYQPHPTGSTGFMTSLSDPRISILQMERVGIIVGTFGVPLTPLVADLEEAFQAIPPKLPEFYSDID